MENKEANKFYDDLAKLIKGKALGDVLLIFGSIVADISHSNNIPILEALGRINTHALGAYDELLGDELDELLGEKDESTKH